jgi:hypothetical protein
MVAGLLFFAAMLTASLGESSRELAAEAGETVAVTIDTPPEVAAAISAVRSGKAPRASVPNQAESLVIDEGFEFSTFPPAGWAAGIPGFEDTPDFQWSRETCDVDPRVPGNTAATWSVGGGAGGDLLPCGSNYTQTVTSYLLYGPTDASDFAAGIRLEWLAKHKYPDRTGETDFPFALCVLLSPDGESRCFRPPVAVSNGWAAYRSSQPVTEVAGQKEVFVYLMYRDAAPTGEDFGAFADTVRIIGLTGIVPPTSTATQGPPPTSGPRDIHLPVAMKRAEKLNFPHVTPAAAGTLVDFGTGMEGGTPAGNVTLDAALIGTGRQFQYGHMRVCTRVTWWRLPVGATLSWQWYQGGSQVLPGDPRVNPSFQIGTTSGSASQCLTAELDGVPVPFPQGQFRVASSVNGQPSGSGSFEVTLDPPPGATALPTGQATVAPSPTPQETPTGPCREFIQNGDMERGATVWRFGEQPATGRSLADIIIQGIPATSGTWAARLGGVLIQGGQHIEEISQSSSPVGLIDPTRMLTATLRFNAALLTNETPDGIDTDVLLIGFVNQADTSQSETIGLYSEEDTPAGQYRAYEGDVTELMTARPGWEDSFLVFQQAQDGEDGTNWILDDISLSVCRTDGVAGPDALAPRRPLPNVSAPVVVWPVDAPAATGNTRLPDPAESRLSVVESGSPDPRPGGIRLRAEP